MRLSFSAPINDRSYGNVSRNLLLQMVQQNHEITLFPIGGVQCSQEESYIIKTCLDNQATYSSNDISVRLYHQFSLSDHPGKVRVGFPIFELDKFKNTYPHFERSHLNSQDLILVCSRWAQQVIKDELNREAKLVPLGVDRTIFYERNTPNNSDDYVFIAEGKWELRKSFDILNQAFSAAFEPRDKVRLKMLCYNPFLVTEKSDVNQEWTNYYKSSKMGDRIDIIPWLPNQSAVADLMRSCDCGIYISRAEGWDLGLLESLSCGLPCIVTNNTGHMTFCNNDNSFLINSDEVEEANDGIWFHGGANWWKWTDDAFDQLVQRLRYCYKNRVRINNSGILTAQQYTWDNAAQILVKQISKLTGEKL
jgi:glycosyltransferase involved in cell wall biosynthesis